MKGKVKVAQTDPFADPLNQTWLGRNGVLAKDQDRISVSRARATWELFCSVPGLMQPGLIASVSICRRLSSPPRQWSTMPPSSSSTIGQAVHSMLS